MEGVQGDALALGYFLLVWIGYGHYAKHRAKKGEQLSLSRAMRSHRDLWAARMLLRDNRIVDSALLANQERVVGFFASTTLLLLAAVLTALFRASEIAELTSHVAFGSQHTEAEMEFKLFILLLVLVYAFFKITWALRQYGFANVLLGSAPGANEVASEEACKVFAAKFARLMDLAGHDNNSCLRAYYFALAVVFWFASNVAFILATSVIVLILANREFRSDAVVCILEAHVPVAQGANNTSVPRPSETSPKVEIEGNGTVESEPTLKA